jgi:hypothetical protein
MLKRTLLIAALMALIAGADPQISRTVTFTTGTAIRVATIRTMANSLFIEALPGGSSVVYVLYADPAIACSTSTAGQTVAVLAAATATAPGGNFTFPSNNNAATQAGGVNVQNWCVAGTTGDTAVISYNVNN